MSTTTPIVGLEAATITSTRKAPGMNYEDAMDLAAEHNATLIDPLMSYYRHPNRQHHRADHSAAPTQGVNMTHKPIRPGNDLPKHPKTARTTALVLTAVGALAWIGIIAAGIAYIWELTDL